MSETDIMDRLEQFASKPNDAGRYPTDAECDAYEAKLRNNTLGHLIQKVIADAPQGVRTDFGVLLNRIIKASPSGITISTLRAQLQHALL